MSGRSTTYAPVAFIEGMVPGTGQSRRHPSVRLGNHARTRARAAVFLTLRAMTTSSLTLHTVNTTPTTMARHSVTPARGGGLHPII